MNMFTTRCPKCGRKNTAALTRVKIRGGGIIGFRATCMACNYSTKRYDTDDDAIHDWNQSSEVTVFCRQ